MWKDQIVEEVRAVRERIAAECGYDFHKMVERAREVLDRWPGKALTGKDPDKRRRQRASETRP